MRSRLEHTLMFNRRNCLLILVLSMSVVIAGCVGDRGGSTQTLTTTPDDSAKTLTTTSSSSTQTPTTTSSSLTTVSLTQIETNQNSTKTSSARSRANLSRSSAHTNITFTEQVSNGTTVIVANATLSETGFVVIIDGCSIANDSRARVLGASRALDPGQYTQIPIRLEIRLDETQPLTAVIFNDTSGDGHLDTDGSDELVDAANGSLVYDTALVRIESTTSVSKDNETTLLTDCGN